MSFDTCHAYSTYPFHGGKVVSLTVVNAVTPYGELGSVPATYPQPLTPARFSHVKLPLSWFQLIST